MSWDDNFLAAVLDVAAGSLGGNDIIGCDWSWCCSICWAPSLCLGGPAGTAWSSIGWQGVLVVRCLDS